MPLTLAQKSSVRRHLEYPVAGLFTTTTAGGTLASGNAGYRYFESWGQLEFRLNNLAPDEEARLTGYAYGGIALVGPNPNIGDTVSVTLSGGTLSAPVTVSYAAVQGDTALSMIANLAGACSLNTALQSAKFLILAPFGTGPYAMNATTIPISEMAITNPVAFIIAAAGTGRMAPQITANGVLLSPSTTLDGVTTINGYLPILDGLENAHASASQNLDTQRADVWYARSNETGQRLALYKQWQQKLAQYLSIPLNKLRQADVRASGVALA